MMTRAPERHPEKYRQYHGLISSPALGTYAAAEVDPG